LRVLHREVVPRIVGGVTIDVANVVPIEKVAQMFIGDRTVF